MLTDLKGRHLIRSKTKRRNGIEPGQEKERHKLDATDRQTFRHSNYSLLGVGLLHQDELSEGRKKKKFPQEFTSKTWKTSNDRRINSFESLN